MSTKSTQERTKTESILTMVFELREQLAIAADHVHAIEYDGLWADVVNDKRACLDHLKQAKRTLARCEKMAKTL